MAATNKQKALARYNGQIAAAKADYLKNTGKKIAAGFKETKEYKRIVRNKKQYQYRESRKGALREVHNRTKFEDTIILVSREIYHLVLGYNDRLSRAIRDAYQKIKAKARKEGRAVWVEVNYPNGRRGLYSSMQKIDQAFSELYQMGLEAQRVSGQSDALFIDARQTDGKEGYYFFVDGYYDRNQSLQDLYDMAENERLDYDGE